MASVLARGGLTPTRARQKPDSAMTLHLPTAHRHGENHEQFLEPLVHEFGALIPASSQKR